MTSTIITVAIELPDSICIPPNEFTVVTMLRRVSAQLLRPSDNEMPPLCFTITYSDDREDPDAAYVLGGQVLPDDSGYGQSIKPVRQHLCIDMAQTGKALREKASHCGLSAQKICGLLNLNRPESVYHWFQGKALPTVEHLYKLHLLLQCHMEDLLVAS